MSNVVRITIHPAGHLFRDPSDKAENTAFVFQIYDDFLEEMPSSAVIRHYVNALERGELTRGEVVVELMSHPDFETIRWVIMTYLTVLGDPPTPDLLRQGIELLEDPEGELPDGGDGVFFDLDREPPLGLPLLVFEILGSDEFWIKHGESGREGQMHTSTLLDIVWKNLGRTWRSNDQKEEERGQLEFMGRPFYLTELVARNYDSLEDRAERAALVILLLDKELDRETLDSYRKFGSIDEFAAWVLTRAEFVTRFGDTQNFVAVESTRDLSREKISWLGTFDDTFFDYAEPAGWIFHTEHGWLYTAGGEDLTGVWFWDHSVQEWLWTRSDHYPLFYRDENQQWIYYRVGSGPDDRQFKFYQEGIGWTSEWQTFPR